MTRIQKRLKNLRDKPSFKNINPRFFWKLLNFWKELSNRLKKQITEDEYKNRILLVCFERQLRYSKIGKLVLKDEFKYYKLLEEHCRRKMHLFPYHLQVKCTWESLFVLFWVTVLHNMSELTIIKITVRINIAISEKIVHLESGYYRASRRIRMSYLLLGISVANIFQ